MTLTINGKNYIAQHFGISNCFVASGVSYTDPAGITTTGSTMDVVTTLKLDDGGLSKGPNNEVYSDIVAGNDGGPITNTDIAWIGSNDGTPAGENQYCKVVDVVSLEWIRSKYDKNNSCYLEEDELTTAYLDVVNNVITTEQYIAIKDVYNNNTYLCAVTPTPTPTPTPGKSTWTIADVKDTNGVILTTAQVWVDGVYTKHYAPETLTFCTGCKCDTIVPCDYGLHTVTIKKSGYNDWVKTKTILEGAPPVTDYPVLTLTTVIPTPTPTPPGPTPTPPAPEVAGIFEFIGPVVGYPTVILDLSELEMKQATDYHFEMNKVKITNTSNYPVYLAMRIRLFEGGLTVCPTTGFVFDGMDRTTYKNVRVKKLEVGETAYYNADFYQPPTILGKHTICMLIHGAWTNSDLLDEIVPILG